MTTSRRTPQGAAALIPGALVLFHFAVAMPIAAQPASAEGPATARIQARVVSAAEIQRSQALAEAMTDALKADLPSTPRVGWVLRREDGSVVAELRATDPARAPGAPGAPTMRLTLAHLGS